MAQTQRLSFQDRTQKENQRNFSKLWNSIFNQLFNERFLSLILSRYLSTKTKLAITINIHVTPADVGEPGSFAAYTPLMVKLARDPGSPASAGMTGRFLYLNMSKYLIGKTILNIKKQLKRCYESPLTFAQLSLLVPVDPRSGRLGVISWSARILK